MLPLFITGTKCLVNVPVSISSWQACVPPTPVRHLFSPLGTNISEIFFFSEEANLCARLQAFPFTIFHEKKTEGRAQRTVSSRLKWSYVAINCKLGFATGRTGASTQLCLSRSRTAIQLKRHFCWTRSIFPSLLYSNAHFLRIILLYLFFVFF